MVERFLRPTRDLDVSLLGRLPPKARRGSKPRSHWMTHGVAPDVAHRLTELSGPWAVVSDGDQWMPMGFEVTEEAQLHDAPRLVDSAVSRVLMDWWLPHDCAERRTPNWDIASSCMVGDTRGLLLVEAKAHDVELRTEAAGRNLGTDATVARKESHETIGRAIEEAADGIRRDTALRCQLSRDSCYQMSNRFAWAWKLATLGIPVVLVYLGFLRAREMADRGRSFESHAEWEDLVREHSEPLIDGQVWNSPWMIDGVTPLIPLIASSVALAG